MTDSFAKTKTIPDIAKQHHDAENVLHRWFLKRCSLFHPSLQYLVLFIFGALSGLSFAPLYLLPTWVIGFAVVIWWVRNSENSKEVFLGAWNWGLGHFLPGIYWITSSFFIDAARFGWLALPVVGLLGVYLALYPAIAIFAAWKLTRRYSLGFVCALASFWTIAEIARGWMLTGFPWNLAAYVWGFSLPMMQSVSIWGSFGLSLITLFVTALLVIGLGRPWPMAFKPILATLTILALLFAFGMWSLGRPEPQSTGLRLRLVQANISQWDKLTGNDREGQVLKHIRLSFREGVDKLAAVIWPETAATFFLDREPALRQLIGSAAPRKNPGEHPDSGYVITGGLRSDSNRYWNSLYALDGAGNIQATFDKFHLVPLGEFVPLRRYLPFVGKLTGGGGNFSEGTGPATLHVPGLPKFSALICYEIIFPGAVLDKKDRPNWLLNITNDGWFGSTSGPHQHLAIARFRAIEEGLPLVRAANSGISALIDAKGRILARTKLGEETTLDVLLPGALGPTLFARFGTIFMIGGLVFFAGVAFLVCIRFRIVQ